MEVKGVSCKKKKKIPQASVKQILSLKNTYVFTLS
jgi:hypothetical protein